MMIFKNTASQKLRVFAFADPGHATLDAGEPVTGDAAQITARTAVDNAALGASNDTNPAEIDATNAKGYYEFDLTQAETNGDIIEFYAQSSTAGVQVVTVGGSNQMTHSPNLPGMFVGITVLAEWLGAIAGKQASDATAQTEMRATGAGSGTYDATTDSQEAIRDRGDAAWTDSAAATFPNLLVSTTIATLASQTSFTLTAGSSDDNAYKGMTAVIIDAADTNQRAVGVISAYTGSTKTVTLKRDPGIFTMATTDTIKILAETPDTRDILSTSQARVNNV